MEHEIVDALVLRAWSAKPKNPKFKLSPMADDAITWGSIGGLGSLVYIHYYSLWHTSQSK